jgi:transposase-like protein
LNLKVSKWFNPLPRLPRPRKKKKITPPYLQKSIPSVLEEGWIPKKPPNRKDTKMPPTATLEEIKAYQQKVEKDKITAHNLPPCPRCGVDSAFFKLHAYRERRFLVIVDMSVRSAFCTLVRFSCPGCGKTFTYYPDFALPHKHYTCASIMGFSGTYVESDDTTYKQTVMVDGSTPGYPGGERTLAPTTIHRWITTLGGFVKTCQKALKFLLQEDPLSRVCRDLAQWIVPRRKYKNPQRKKLLLVCRRLCVCEVRFQVAFKTSIFTKLAIRCAFS